MLWRLSESAAVSEAQRARLLKRLASKLDTRGGLRVVAADTRSQSRNRELALERLAGVVRAALVVPKVRRATKPTYGSKIRRLDTKKRRSTQKRDRRLKHDD